MQRKFGDSAFERVTFLEPDFHGTTFGGYIQCIENDWTNFD